MTDTVRLLYAARSDVGLRRPTLDDVFLTLTGREADESATTEEAPR